MINSLALTMTDNQKRMVNNAAILHKAVVTNVIIELTTPEGQKILIPNSAVLYWMRRDEVVDDNLTLKR